MRTVALVCHYLGPKLGIGQYLDQLLPPLVDELTSRELQVTLISSPNAEEMTPAIRNLKHCVDVLPPLDTSPWRRWIWFATQFNQYCHQHQIEGVVWLSNPIVLPWHPPSIAVIHDVNEWKSQAKYGSRARTFMRSLIYLDASLTFAKRIVAVSQSTQQDLQQFRPSNKLESKLSTIVNGTDTTLVGLPPVEITQPNAPFLLSVGRIDPIAKRLPESINLALSLRGSSGEPWEIHFVGGMNASTQQTGQDFLVSVKDLPWVHYHGHVSDSVLAQWYRNATAIVFLSDQEGFGLPIAEACSFGRWAIVSQHNLAATEAGRNAVIAIDPDQPMQAAIEVLRCIKTSNTPPVDGSFSSWKSAANQYADDILQILPCL